MADVGVAGCFNSQELIRRAILLSLGDDPSSTAEVNVELYKVALVYTDIGGDKAMIASDTDLIDVGSQFNAKGEVKVFVTVQINKDKEESPNVQSTKDKDKAEAKNLADLIADGIHRYFEDAQKAADNKREQNRVEFVRRYVEDANKAKEKKQAALIVEASTRRSLEDAKKAEEQKQADADTQSLQVAVDKKEEKDAQSETLEESETIDTTAREQEEQVGNSDEQESDDETAVTTPPLAALKEYQEYQIFYSKASPLEPLPLPKEIELFSEDDESTDESNSEEEQVGSSDEEEESDDETADFTPPLVTRYQMFCTTALLVKPLLPKELDIVSKVDAVTSFASDAEGSGEIAAVLGETLDRVAQAIDDMHSEFDRTASAEEIEKDIVAENAKEVNDESWHEELDSIISEVGENVKDDCSHDSWNVVSEHSDNAGSRD
jgi:hypothetical protein